MRLPNIPKVLRRLIPLRRGGHITAAQWRADVLKAWQEGVEFSAGLLDARAAAPGKSPEAAAEAAGAAETLRVMKDCGPATKAA